MIFSFDIDKYTAMLDAFAEKKIKYRVSCPLSSLTTFKIGGPCAVAVFAESATEIVYALRCAHEMDISTKVLGRGSNILCSDD